MISNGIFLGLSVVDPLNPIDDGIEVLTRSKYVHAFLLINGIVHEIIEPSAHQRPLTNGEKADFFSIRCVNKIDISNIQSWLEIREDNHEKYSIEDLFKIAFGIAFPTTKQAICSAYVTQCLNDNLPKEFWPFSVNTPPSEITPRDLSISPIFTPANPFTP